jgi:hypothetical protein
MRTGNRWRMERQNHGTAPAVICCELQPIGHELFVF